LDDLLERHGAGPGHLDRAQPLGAAVGAGVVRARARAHPVFRPPVVGALGQAAEPPGQRAAFVEAVERVVGQRHGLPHPPRPRPPRRRTVSDPTPAPYSSAFTMNPPSTSNVAEVT